MRHPFTKLLVLCATLIASTTHADTALTHRTPMFENEKVNVWETIVYPKNNQILKPHHHDFNRLLIPSSDGVLKIVNNKGESHLLKLAKGKAYYLSKDPINETHTDENIGTEPVTVVVVELK
jgi:hypothetical protein